MKTLCRSWLFIVLLAGWLSAPVSAQTASVIPDTEAAQHVGQECDGREYSCRGPIACADLMKTSYRWSGDVAGIGVRLPVLPDEHSSTVGVASPAGFST